FIVCRREFHLRMALPRLSVASIALLALSQQRRLTSTRKRDAILDTHRPAIGLVEDRAPGIVVHRKNEPLPFLHLSTGLENYLDRKTGRRHCLGRQNAVAV